MLNKIGVILICSFILLGCSKIDQKKFKSLQRATIAIQVATTEGVNYINFKDVLQKMATELLVVKYKIKTKEEEGLLKKYVDVYDAYKDSLTIWEKKIKNGEPLLFVAELKPLIDRYAIEKFPYSEYRNRRQKKLTAAQYFKEKFYGPDISGAMDVWNKYTAKINEIEYGDGSMFDADAALQTIWQEASSRFKKVMSTQ